MTTTTVSPTIKFAAIAALTLGSQFEGGTFAGVVTLPSGVHAAVVLLPAKPDGRLKWADAVKWAASIDGVLPTRPVAALLYANAKPAFERDWYWTSDSLDADTGDKEDASYAWLCHFDTGGQDYYGKSASGAARAVRLIHLEV